MSCEFKWDWKFASCNVTIKKETQKETQEVAFEKLKAVQLHTGMERLSEESEVCQKFLEIKKYAGEVGKFAYVATPIQYYDNDMDIDETRFIYSTKLIEEVHMWIEFSNPIKLAKFKKLIKEKNML